MVKEGILNTRFGKIAYREWGAPDGPNVLAVHGWLDNAASFDGILPHLSKYHVVAIDFLGHGLSEHRPDLSFYHFIDSVAVVHSILNTLQWNDCIWLGHSMGGAIGCLYAGSFPERIKKLCLIEALGPLSASPDEAPDRTRKFAEQWEGVSAKSLPVYPSSALALRARQMASPVTELGLPLIERALKPVPGGFTWRSDPKLKLDSPLRLTEAHTLAFLKNITAPTLLIRGKQGYLPDSEIMKKRIEKFKSLKMVDLEGGHHLHVDFPLEVAKALEEFLSSSV